MDALYKPEDTDPETRANFDQLHNEFGAKYKIWKRVEDYGRLVRAAVLDPLTGTAAHRHTSRPSNQISVEFVGNRENP